MLAVLQFPRSEPPLWPFFPAEQATLKLGLLLGADAPPQIGQVHRLRQLGTPGKPSKYQLFGVWPAALRAKHMCGPLCRPVGVASGAASKYATPGSAWHTGVEQLLRPGGWVCALISAAGRYITDWSWIGALPVDGLKTLRAVLLLVSFSSANWSSLPSSSLRRGCALTDD